MVPLATTAGRSVDTLLQRLVGARGGFLLKAYVINLDRSTDRLAHVRRELGGAGVEFERITAVDGAALDARVIEDFCSRRTAAKPDDWLPGEIGCFLSHREVWQRIAKGPDVWAAVFEDDIHASPDLGALLSSADWLPQDADIVRLEGNRSMRLSAGRAIAVAPGRKVYRALSGTAGSAAYIISARSAERLVNAPPETRATLDVFLFKPKVSAVARTLRRYQVVPAVCIQEEILGRGAAVLTSEIKSRSTRGRGYREHLHPLLRLWPIQRYAVPYRR